MILRQWNCSHQEGRNTEPFPASQAPTRSPQIKNSPCLHPLLVSVFRPDTVARSPRIPWAVIILWFSSLRGGSVLKPAGCRQLMGSSCNLSSRPGEAQCFVSTMVLRQCWGPQSTAFVSQAPLNSQLTWVKASPSPQTSWLLIHCDQVSQDALSFHCFLFSRPSEYLSLE
jgi:hypothetical protein